MSARAAVNAKRFIVEEAVADRFFEALVARVRQLKVGNPMQRGVQIGPMAWANLRDTVHGRVQATVAAGAELKLR